MNGPTSERMSPWNPIWSSTSARAARRVEQHRAAVVDHHAIERQLVGIEADRNLRNVDAAGGVDAERDLGTVEMQLGGAPFAPHERPETELDPEHAGAQLGRAARLADLDVVEKQ